MDLVEQGEADLSRVTVTVLDEADHMADLGFMPQVTSLLDHTPKGGQRLLFSATLDRDVDKLVRRYLKDPATHSVSPATASVDAMDHHVLVVAPHDKNEVTARIAARSGRTVVFVRTKHGADRLATSLRKVGVRAGSLHGGKTQSARSATLDDFRSGTVSVLVATDVAARGIHVDDVTLVLHADMANDHKDYLHRSGRTARAGEAGTVVSLITPGQRRAAEAMTRRAGVTAGNSRVAPDSANLVEITGAQEPAGVPWEQPVRSGGGSGPRGRRRSGPARGGRAAASGRSGRRSSGGSGGGGYSGGGRGGSSGRRSASRGCSGVTDNGTACNH
jgi:superfamily II DNA/RNA helicase